MIAEAERAVDEEKEEEIIEQAAETEKIAMRIWKSEDIKNSVKHQRMLLERGIIDKLPWEDYLKPIADFGDDEAALEAAKWAQEQLQKSNEKPVDHLVESESKKKITRWMEKEGTQQIIRSKEE